MTLQEVLELMNSRFTSLNSIPVERASIRREEWDLILQALSMDNGRGDTFYECPSCRSRSYNPNDIRYCYCGRCHKFEDEHDRGPEARGENT